MRCIGQLRRKILTCPMLIVNAISPVATMRYLIDDAFVGHPDFFPVLAVARGQLAAGVFFQIRLLHERNRLQRFERRWWRRLYEGCQRQPTY